MKTSRAVFSEIQKKAGPFPFTLRSLDNEQRARMGVQEAVAHGLLKPYDIVQTAAGTVVAEFFFTSGFRLHVYFNVMLIKQLPSFPLALYFSPLFPHGTLRKLIPAQSRNKLTSQ
jgi:hypothetical protein